MDAKGLPLNFSNWGETYQNNGILALGDKLMGAIPGGSVTTKSGTSFATPIVSGIVALLLSFQIQRGDKPDPFAVREAILQSAHPCFPSKGLDCSHHLRGRLNIEGAHSLVTKKHQAVTDSGNSVQQIQGSASIGPVEPSKLPPVLGVRNAEFITPNPEIATSSTQSSALDSLRTLENPDSIESKSIDKEKNKQTKKWILEENMTELIDETCGCPKRQIKAEEMNELNGQTSDGTEITVPVPRIHASDVQAAESTITNHEAATPSVIPAQAPPTQSVCSRQSLVYVIGTLGYDFGSEARRDSFIQNMEEDWPCSDNPAQLVTFLKKNPEYAEALIWTLEIDGTPVYAIRPGGSFASITYQRLREFLKAHQNEGVERVSIPGVIGGKIRLFSGQVVPVIMPELRGMYSWSTRALVNAVAGPVSESAYESTQKKRLELEAGIGNFLDRVYYELRNLGRASQERAMNFAGTNAFQAFAVFEQAVKDHLVLDSIETERSPVCRPDSDCWDVKLTFFDPDHRLTVARRVYRFTIDVSDVIPVTVEEVRSWAIY
jgi:cyanobactin maturation PatA/PatG family protease